MAMSHEGVIETPRQESSVASLIRCIYSSVASDDFREDDLPELLKSARIANTARGITGMLVYINGNFLQVIEGSEASVDQLFAKISKDPRHKRVNVIIREPIPRRSIAGWSMGFEALVPAYAETLIGENDFFDSSSCVDAMAAGTVKTILTLFRQAQTQSGVIPTTNGLLPDERASDIGAADFTIGTELGRA